MAGTAKDAIAGLVTFGIMYAEDKQPELVTFLPPLNNSDFYTSYSDNPVDVGANFAVLATNVVTSKASIQSNCLRARVCFLLLTTDNSASSNATSKQ
jgi:hypothetical protein